MSYAFPRFLATCLTGSGVALLGGGATWSGSVLFFGLPPWVVPESLTWPARMGIMLGPVVLGGPAGFPLMVMGQLLRVEVDQRRLLSRINARLRRWEEDVLERGGQSGVRRLGRPAR